MSDDENATTSNWQPLRPADRYSLADDLAEVQAELERIKAEYERRIEALPEDQRAMAKAVADGAPIRMHPTDATRIPLGTPGPSPFPFAVPGAVHVILDPDVRPGTVEVGRKPR